MEEWYLVHLKKIHEGTPWRGSRTILYFIVTKQISLHLCCNGDQVYNRYKIKQIKKYLDDNGTEVKPKHFSQRGMIYTSGCDPRQEM